jgi:Domain of unknown function (DUF1844)
MAEKKQETFTVTDRRLFTSEGEARETATEERSVHSSPEPSPAMSNPVPATTSSESAAQQPEIPPPPTAAEQQQLADAYSASSKDMDRQVEQGGHSTKELEMTFERFMASLYMSAMMQMGMMHEEGGQPRLDPIGARQTIDTLSLIAEKTKGNLTPTEQNFLQNCLYELRMAYVEVINALSRPPQNPTGVVKPGDPQGSFEKR